MKFSIRPVHAYIIAMAAALAFSTQAEAAGPGWTSNPTVSKLVVTADGGVNVLLSPSMTGCSSNSSYGSGFASNYPSHPLSHASAH